MILAPQLAQRNFWRVSANCFVPVENSFGLIALPTSTTPSSHLRASRSTLDHRDHLHSCAHHSACTSVACHPSGRQMTYLAPRYQKLFRLQLGHDFSAVEMVSHLLAPTSHHGSCLKISLDSILTYPSTGRIQKCLIAGQIDFRYS